MIKAFTFVFVSMFSCTAFAHYDKDMGIDPDFLYESAIPHHAPSPEAPPTHHTPTPQTPAMPQTQPLPTNSTGQAFSALEIGAEAIALTEAGTTAAASGLGTLAATTSAAIAGGAGSAALASSFAVGAIAAPVIGSHATAGLLFLALNENNGTTSTNSNSASAAQ
jgi:hypothetical protein